MKESVTYQLLVAEGRGEGRLVGREEGQVQGKAQEARRLLRLLGDKRLGAPSEEQASKVVNEARQEQLALWVERRRDASSWAEVLA